MPDRYTAPPYPACALQEVKQREESLSVLDEEITAEMAPPFPEVSAMFVKLHPVMVDEVHSLSIFTRDAVVVNSDG